MRQFIKGFRRLMRLEDGPTAVEFAVILALMALVSVAAIRTLSTKSNTTVTGTVNSTAN